MEAKDLMQFDWVCLEDDSTPRQVDSIRTGEVGLYWNKIVTPPYIKPIPLTPEILEKNGFSDKYAEDDLSYATDYCGEVIGVHIYGKSGIMDEMYFKHVHEIQHALRLCGIKKEIVL